MRISMAQVLLSAQHRQEQHYTRTEHLSAGFATRNGAWGVQQRADGRVAAQHLTAQANKPAQQLDEYLERSMQDSKVLKANQPPLQAPQANQPVPKNKTAVTTPQQTAVQPLSAAVEASPQEKANIQLITAAIEGISGKKIRLAEQQELVLETAESIDPATFQPAATPAQTASFNGTPPPDPNPQSAPPTETAFGLHYRKTETYSESESMTFSAQGRIHTADGAEITVDVEVNMSRQFYSENTLDIKMEGVLKDPLVVNFAAPAAALTQTKYRFDIDSDGQDDQIHFVSPGSGFLALDRDDNGAIDNGRELFGATSGNGFNDLAAFDTDGNRFIDSGDPVYDRLRIWSKDQEGNDSLVALGQRGIGAIYLDHAATSFSLKNEHNQLAGMVRSSSFFLREDGSSGSIQQIDLVV